MIRSRSTDIIFNDMLDDFSWPGIINHGGLSSSPLNIIEPGKQPLSSLSPTIIVDRNNNVRLLIGAAGGPKITSSVALVRITEYRIDSYVLFKEKETAFLLIFWFFTDRFNFNFKYRY